MPVVLLDLPGKHGGALRFVASRLPHVAARHPRRKPDDIAGGDHRGGGKGSVSTAAAVPETRGLSGEHAWTVALGRFFRFSHSFGETYGPLAGMVALMMWAVLSSTVLIYGAAVAAQLEAVRSGEPEPQDQEKVDDSDPLDEKAPVPLAAEVS